MLAQTLLARLGASQLLLIRLFQHGTISSGTADHKALPLVVS
jgi:hypothetical protein